MVLVTALPLVEWIALVLVCILVCILVHVLLHLIHEFCSPIISLVRLSLILPPLPLLTLIAPLLIVRHILSCTSVEII